MRFQELRISVFFGWCFRILGLQDFRVSTLGVSENGIWGLRLWTVGWDFRTHLKNCLRGSEDMVYQRTAVTQLVGA